MSDHENSTSSRRGVLSGALGAGMGGGLVAAYGGVGLIAARYLYPAKGRDTVWLFVAELDAMKVGDAMAYQAPDGARITVARRADAGDVSDFVALSTTCPHLGCNVHWEPHHNRFFCPCHNGVFTPEGVAVEGPPADAGQSLAQYPLHVREGLLFIQVPTDGIAAVDGGDTLEEIVADRAPGPGHDPCLAPPPRRKA